MNIILKDRMEQVLGMSLAAGSHTSINKGACIMEMVSYVAGEPWADHPMCACPILTEYAIRMNDRFNDEDRQKLKPLILLLVGTRASEETYKATQIARKRFIMWRNVTVTYPFILDKLNGCEEFSAKIRAFQNTEASMFEAAAYILEIRNKVRKISDANANAAAAAHANAYAYADAAHADAYADAYAYAYANANAKKFRSDLADIAVETLRLAIEIKK